MENALIFVFRALIELYIITFVLRLIMQWIRADTRNPLVQFILRVTNPLVVPLRRYVPTAWGFDTATFIVLFVIQALATTAFTQCGLYGYTSHWPNNFAEPFAPGSPCAERLSVSDSGLCDIELDRPGRLQSRR